MRAPFRVAVSARFRRTDGRWNFPYFDLSPLAENTAFEVVHLGNGSTVAASEVRDFDGLILAGEGLPREALEEQPRLCVVARFGVPAAKLGLGYRFEGIRRLASIVGPSFAAEIFFTGRQFSAQEALDMGLINRIVPTAELEKYALDYANTIALNAPLTIAAVKRSLIEFLKDPAARDLALCQKMVDACYESEDYKEGQAAFMEKRKPQFKGR